MEEQFCGGLDERRGIVAASGYFDPLHKGHIDYLKLSKQLGNKLVVILNNDKQAALKKGKSFMPQEERRLVLESLEFVDEVFMSIDDDKTVCKSIEAVNPNIFAKGGDQFSNEIPEVEVCKRLGIKIIDGLGEKIQSSSNLIKKSRATKVERAWGSYTVLEEGPSYKIKIIEVKSGNRLSLQKHMHRSEHWIVVSGTAEVTNGNEEIIVNVNESTYIPKNTLHRLENPGKIPLQIIEVQNGEYLEEDDIERFDDDYGRVNNEVKEL
ncbi:adenylyltransferase/cytidyltransferase family protein [Candidatus Pacearchaeota archaeon]|nr:adenylyltransferase/cytidyltransferase family protein [Candidatus Pacearchaeota archaeon]